MKFKTVAAIVAGMFISAVVHAVPIVNTNVRPVVLGATPAGEQSLQTVLNSVFGTGAVSAANNQSAAGLWGSATGSATTIPTLIIEQTGGAASQKFGMVWYRYSSIYTVDLFRGAVGAPNTLQQSVVGIGIGDVR